MISEDTSASAKQKQEQEEFEPYIKHWQSIPEFTWRAVILGVVLAIVLGATNAYLGLKVGMTVSASIPAAVISMAILRGLFRTGTILENNIAQTVGSSGEALAAGIIFTIPAIMLLRFEETGQLTGNVTLWEILLPGILGGLLGILLMIPIRRYLIVQEHGVLPYPEGTACAEVLSAGDEGGKRAVLVGSGVGIGAVYEYLMGGARLWKSEVSHTFAGFNKATLAAEITPALLGVGYIIGPKIAAMVFAGGALGWLVLVPLISFIGGSSTLPIAPAPRPVQQLSPAEIWHYYIRYIGAGAVAVGGLVSLVKVLPVIGRSFKLGIMEIVRRVGMAIPTKRTERDIPMSMVLVGALVMVVAIFFLLQGVLPDGASGVRVSHVVLQFVAACLVVIFGFFFVTVASRLVGIVGSSSNPVSGMTITTLLFTLLVFVWLGYGGSPGMVAALTVGAVVCIAICMASDASQDLKTGYLVGSTPYKQQVAEFLGVILPAVFISLVLMHILQAPLLEGEFKAPQANLMKMVTEGVMSGNLPWSLVIIGMVIGVVIELLGFSSLPFAIGVYLPISLSAPILVGGIVHLIASKAAGGKMWKVREERGVLFSSGLVAGGALMGMTLIVLSQIRVGNYDVAWFISSPQSLMSIIHEWLPGGWEDLFGMAMFLVLAAVLAWVTRVRRAMDE